MISSMIDLRTTASSSDKLEKDIADAVEDLLSTEQGDFSVYAEASLPQLQALNANISLTPKSLQAQIDQIQAHAGREARSSIPTLEGDIDAKAYNPNRLINLDLTKHLASERTLTTGITEPLLPNQGNKNIFQPSKHSQLTAPPLPVSNQVLTTLANTLKGDISPQANMMMNQLIQSNSQITDSDPAALAITTANRTQAAVSQWGPVSVSAAAPLAQQAQEMLTPLREQLRFQIDQKIKQAELRLDPPSLGKVELSIRLDGDRLHIQMHAANPNVRDSLLTGLERLREELAMDHGGQIELDIGQGEKHTQQGERHASKISDHPMEMVEPELPQQDKQQTNQIDLLA